VRIARPADLTGPERLKHLARTFVEEVASIDPRPWLETLAEWPPALELTALEQQDLRKECLKQRVFSATEIGAANARRRRRR
jgi:hypothetical protein